jgi:AraC family transcriptional regulator of adaptative response / DNA-3-methyladenine glycosylase II
MPCPPTGEETGTMTLMAQRDEARSAGPPAAAEAPAPTPAPAGWAARDDLVARAVRLLDDGLADRAGPDAVAAALGVTPAALADALVAELGAGTEALAEVRRAATRRALAGATTDEHGWTEVTVRLAYRPPLPFAETLPFLAARAVPGVEEVVDGRYRRVLRLPHGPAVADIAPPTPSKGGAADGGAGGGWLVAWFSLADARDLAPAIARCRRLFDLDADPAAVLAALGDDPLIGAAVRAAPGRRAPGHVDGAELAVRAVLGQQVSVAAARTLAGRLAARHGTPLPRPSGGLIVAFPSAEVLADADLDGLGITGARIASLHRVSAAIATGAVDLGPGARRDAATAGLVALPGIGPWTADYVRMRTLGDPDTFLPTDLGVRRALERLGEDGRPRAAAARAEAWRPFRSYALQHLWATLAAPAPDQPPPAAPAPATAAPGRRSATEPPAPPATPAPRPDDEADSPAPAAAAGRRAVARRRGGREDEGVRRWVVTSTPVAELLLVADGDGALVGVHFQPDRRWGVTVGDGWVHDPAALAPAADQLAAYFAGELTRFDLPLAPVGTPFQRAVWDELLAIPYGGTTSYRELAEMLGRPGSARAVGSANARNPLAIVVPCHRVVGADRSLTGYAGGLDVKRALLRLESGARTPS